MYYPNNSAKKSTIGIKSLISIVDCIAFMYQKYSLNCGCFLITIAALYKALFKAYNTIKYFLNLNFYRYYNFSLQVNNCFIVAIFLSRMPLLSKTNIVGVPVTA